MAGGRISGLYARAARTRIKALVPVAGEPAVRRVVEALNGAAIHPVVVVGPEAVREVLNGAAEWTMEVGSALANLGAGLQRLNAAGEARALVCGCDVPALASEAVRDFVDRAPVEAAACIPLVRRAVFRSAFPGNFGIYVRLREGSFTAGSQFLFRSALVRGKHPLMQQLFDRRKSQLGMARTLGAGLIARLVTWRLSIGEVEDRVSALAGSPCRAVADCRPELAYDIDSLF